ncbi:WSCD family member CG9164-like [Haliotis rubra]|uniref:WSCD family member CG9164-like n=1 Tax=Haliotis rubra TaxID=36100 RepID=UPI001EE52484|nr:WSCD family member CG9164-like [Haliotis rubra]
MMNTFRRFYRRLKSSVVCVVVYIVVINIVCLYYLSRSPSPWISHHGPFFLAHLRRGSYTCKTIGFSPTPMPLTALASFPGSGNTWLRHLVQQATGIATGSVYNDVTLKQHGFPGKGVRDGRVVMVKTHEWGSEHRRAFSRAVLLIRDPFDSLLAEFNRRNGGHRGHALPHDFAKGWQTYVSLQSRGWVDMNTDWLKFDGPLLIMQYRDLQTNMLNETRRLFNFLDMRVSDPELVCMVSNAHGKFKRPKIQVSSQVYSSFMRSTIGNYIQNVTKEIQNYYKLRKS